MHWPDFITFASDATRFALWGAGLLTLSLLAALGDRRRARRKHVDDVGIMPWRDIAALTGFPALVLLGLAAIGWLQG